MINIFAIILTTLFFVGSGWYLSLLITKAGIIERLGLSFFLGAGLTTFLWFCESLIRLPLNLTTLVIAGAVVSLISFLVTRHARLGNNKPNIYWDKQAIVISIAISTLLLIAIAIAIYSPLTAWDAIALYDFRGHAIALEHNLNFSKLGSYFMSYPLMTSLSHSIVYMIGGTSAQGLYAVIYTAFIMVIYGRLKAWTNNKYALVGSLLLVSQSELFSHATFAYTNLPYTAYLILGLIYAATASTGSLILSGILIGLSTWVRSAEVFWIIGILLIVWQGIRIKSKRQLVVGIICILFFKFSWSIYLSQMFVSLAQTTDSNLTHFSFLTITKIIENLWEISKYLYWNIYLPYIGMWFITIPSLVIALVKKNTRLLMLVSVVLLSAFMVVGGVMIFSTYYETWNQIGDSAKRMMLFIIPLSIIHGIYALYLINNKHD